MRTCHAAYSRPLTDRQQADYIANSVAVSAGLGSSAARALSGYRTTRCQPDSCSQVFLYGLAAVISAICYGLQHRLLLWRRRGWEVVGDRIWKHLSTYSGWMCAGCFAGAVAFAVDFRAHSLNYEKKVPGNSERQIYELDALRQHHVGAFTTFASVSFLATIFALSMLLRRVSDHASHR